MYLAELISINRLFVRLPAELRDEVYGYTIILNRELFTAFH